ncbi:MAG: hypothetical protein E7Z90_04150 [Cyanobacteria bacterium SIG29]|nr:hypothetical protein [Cyanobacteria bacterium SIG29]
MKKLYLFILSFFITFFMFNITFASDNKVKDKLKKYKETETISLDNYLLKIKNSKDRQSLKINKYGDVTYKKKVIITSTGETINNFNCGDSYLLLKIYIVASGAKPHKGCDEKNYIENGIYGLGCYIDRK